MVWRIWLICTILLQAFPGSPARRDKSLDAFVSGGQIDRNSVIEKNLMEQESELTFLKDTTSKDTALRFSKAESFREISFDAKGGTAKKEGKKRCTCRL